jgi:glycosyltransferase involved in cell wall biosynthesis
MKILHVSTDDIYGGAARAAYRLHAALAHLGQASQMLVLRQRTTDPAVTRFEYPMELRARLRRRVRRWRIARAAARYREMRPPGAELFNDDRSEHGAAVIEQLPPADVLNLHWIANFVDLPTFLADVPARLPVVWTLHDMQPFTGGCHYDRGCGRFAETCGACPQLGSQRRGDLSRAIWGRKAVALASVAADRLHLVAPSHWMADEVRRSSLLGRFPVTVIPNGLDTGVFAPVGQAAARTALRVPVGARIVLFLADELAAERKGFGLLCQALAGLEGVPDLFLISVGSHQPALDLPVPQLHLGRVEHDRLLALVYSAADVFALPSLQDNLPNTALEALACGTPVVGFAAGGVPDVVRDGETGWLAPPGDVDGLRAALKRLLADKALCSELAETCRQVAVAEYDRTVMARAYLELYASVR